MKRLRKLSKKIGRRAALLLALGGSSTALAINAFVSQDIPFLTTLVAQNQTQISQGAAQNTAAAEEIAQGVEMLEQAQRMAKTLEGIGSLSQGDPRDAMGAAMGVFEAQGLSVPEFMKIHELDFANPNSIHSVHSSLQKAIYEDLKDFDRASEENAALLATALEAEARNEAKRVARQKYLASMDDECSKLYGTEEGIEACKMAGAKAGIYGAQGIHDGNEQRAHQIELQSALLKIHERKRVAKKRSIVRFAESIRDLSKNAKATRRRRNPAAKSPTAYIASGGAAFSGGGN